MRLRRIGVLVLAAAGCVSTAGSKVTLTYERDDVRDCRLLKRIRESAGGWAFGSMGGGSSAASWNENEMRNDTAELGGNVVLVINANRGEAYLCPESTLARIGEAGPVTPSPTSVPPPTPSPTP